MTFFSFARHRGSSQGAGSFLPFHRETYELVSAPGGSVVQQAEPPAQVASLAPTAMATAGLPKVGERWRYRYTDQWKPSQRKACTINSP